MNAQQLNDIIRPLVLPDLRIECRRRGLNPAGGREALADRVRANMLETGDFTVNIYGEVKPIAETAKVVAAPTGGNNYSRPEGQNVGNFMTDRNSSRVVQPPGGASQIFFGGDSEPATSPLKAKVDSSHAYESPGFEERDQVASPLVSPQKFSGAASPIAGSMDAESPRIAAEHGGVGNNYHRSSGQNVGNFMTNRNSSRVIAPPGGHSNITFG